MAGLWSIRVSGNWRVVFRIEDNEAVDLVDIERRGRAIMAMLNPCHPGEVLRDNLEAAELSVTEAASRLGCTRQSLSRLLNGKAGISPTMALALEGIGWSNASFWMRLQASYELAQARRDRAAAERRAGALHA